ALEARVKELEVENRHLKMNAHSGEPQFQSALINTHEFTMKDSGAENFQSDTYTVGGVEMSVRIEQLPIQAQDLYYGHRDYKFAATLRVKNECAERKKFVMTMLEVKGKSARGEGLLLTSQYSGHVKEITQTEKFVTNSEEKGKRLIFWYSNYQPPDTFIVRITVAVQTVSPMHLDDDKATVVVVKGKEFLVSAEYLSLWSGFFRAYFKADMKEKKEGRYPINDKDISASSFEELLMVIYPSDKPITPFNYKRLLRLASRFEMPELTRRIEMFLIDFDRNGLDRAVVFRLASDVFHLKVVQMSIVLLHRWGDRSCCTTR
ncbi:hypothetical protein PMAYCL1PPCAC_24372, partial [Pristionchus mayeri]